MDHEISVVVSILWVAFDLFIRNDPMNWPMICFINSASSDPLCEQVTQNKMFLDTLLEERPRVTCKFGDFNSYIK